MEALAILPSVIVFFQPPSICLNGEPNPPLPSTTTTSSEYYLQVPCTFLAAAMGEALRSKWRCVYSFDPNTTTYTFSHKYTSYLLHALLRAANGKRSVHVEKIVRFEVDMALVLSTDEFKWSRALKHKLEESKKSNELHISSRCRSEIDHYGILKRFDCLQAFPAIHRPIVLMEATHLRKDGHKSMKKRTPRGDGELVCYIRILRRILPGGSEMSVFELLSEVQSYIVCLQLQVGVLRSLVDAQ